MRQSELQSTIDRHPGTVPQTDTDNRGFRSELLMSPNYRFAVSERLAARTGCSDVILFDHISPTDPSLGKGIKTPLGYEKCLIPAIPLTNSMRAHVLMQAPPLPVEMEFASMLYETVPDAKGLHVWLPDPGEENKFVDGFALYREDKARYEALVRSTLQDPPAGSSTFHVDATPHLIGQQDLGKTLVLPFQTMDWHQGRLAPLIESGQVVLPDSADQWMNKGEAHEYFEQHETGDLRPAAITVPMDDIRETTPENVVTAASRVEEACNEMLDQGKQPFVKLAANGLAGFGIIPTQDNPLLDLTLPPQERSRKFHERVEGTLRDTHNIADAVVEEYIEIETDEAGKKEYILSGIVIDGVFFPWSVSRSITDDQGVYQGVIVSPYSSDLGLSNGSVMTAIEEGQRMATAMAEGGYGTGYLAKDFIATRDANGAGKHMYHDDNDRRGGRTNADHAGALLEEGFCDRNVTVTIPFGQDRADFILSLTNALDAEGLRIYGTGSVYTGADTISLRILSPLDRLREMAKSTESSLDFGNAAIKLIDMAVEKSGVHSVAETVVFKK